MVAHPPLLCVPGIGNIVQSALQQCLRCQRGIVYQSHRAMAASQQSGLSVWAVYGRSSSYTCQSRGKISIIQKMGRGLDAQEQDYLMQGHRRRVGDGHDQEGHQPGTCSDASLISVLILTVSQRVGPPIALTLQFSRCLNGPALVPLGPEHSSPLAQLQVPWGCQSDLRPGSGCCRARWTLCWQCSTFGPLLCLQQQQQLLLAPLETQLPCSPTDEVISTSPWPPFPSPERFHH